jgi:hypothetical protein
LEQVLRVHIEHNNSHRPHRALALQPPDPPAGLHVVGERQRVRCADTTGSAGSSTKTTFELHERIPAPTRYPLGVKVSDQQLARCRSAGMNGAGSGFPWSFRGSHSSTENHRRHAASPI